MIYVKDTILAHCSNLRFSKKGKNNYLHKLLNICKPIIISAEKAFAFFL